MEPKKEKATSQFDDADEKQEKIEAAIAEDTAEKPLSSKDNTSNDDPAPAKDESVPKKDEGLSSDQGKLGFKGEAGKSDASLEGDMKKPAISPSTSNSEQEATEGGANPLDALASACEVEEQMRDSPEVVPESNVLEEATVSGDNIRCTDVLCGRGGQSNHHPGNIFFRRLVRAKQEEYLKANKREKTMVAKDIVKVVRMLTPPGRFLKKTRTHENIYVDVGDVQARNKASQALREGAPELREELSNQYNRSGKTNSEIKLLYGKKQPLATSEPKFPRGNSAELPATHPDARRIMKGGYPGGYPHASYARSAALTGLKPDDRDAPPLAGNEAAAAAMAEYRQAAAAEERARRILLATAPGLASGLVPPSSHLRSLGYSTAAAMHPCLASGGAPSHHYSALQSAGSAGQYMPPRHRAMMMTASAEHPAETAAASLLQGNMGREFAGQMDYAHGTVNPALLHSGGDARVPGSTNRAAASAAGKDIQLPPFGKQSESIKQEEQDGASTSKKKRERQQTDREKELDDAKAAKLSRQYL